MKEKLNAALDRFYEHSVLAVPVSILVFYALWFLVGQLGKTTLVEYAIKLVFGLVFSLAFIWFRKGHMHCSGRRWLGAKNMKLCIPLLVIVLLQFVRPVTAFGAALLNVDVLVYALVLSVEAGICEEMMVRGLPLGNTLQTKATRKQFIGLAFLTSLIFGLIHLTNLFHGGETIPVIMQVVYATTMGMAFAAVYMRTGSIVPTIILHALVDFASFLDPVYTSGEAVTTAPTGLDAMVQEMTAVSPETAEAGPVVFVVLQLLIAAFWLFVALFLLRKSKWEEIKANFIR